MEPAYANGEHERQIRDRFRAKAPRIAVSISSEISPKFREYERTSTTVTNAYVMPMVSRYLEGLEAVLGELGCPGRLRIMQSNGGVVSAALAAWAQMPADKMLPGAGSLLIGEGGTLIIPHIAPPQLYPQEKFGTFEIEKVAGSSHYHAWVDAALGGPTTSDNFDYAGPLTEAVQLGNVATRFPGAMLKWDAASLRIPNHSEANTLLTKQYRDDWKIAPVSA